MCIRDRTIVAAAGAVKIRKGDNINEQNPYLEVPQTQGILAENIPQNKTGNGGSTEKMCIRDSLKSRLCVQVTYR